MYVRGKGVRFEAVEACITLVSKQQYAGNIIVHQDAGPIRQESSELRPVLMPWGTTITKEVNRTGYGYRGRIIGEASSLPGTRRSWSGRRGPWACWHAYRDVMRAILTQYPDAVITSAHARYEGLAGFEITYPHTANVNIGSAYSPAYMPELCDCDDDE